MKKMMLTLPALFLMLAFAQAEPKPAVQVPSAAVAAASAVSPSASKTIKGRVLDQGTSETLAGVSVECNGQKTYTDLDGNFSLNVGVNSSVEVSLISYEKQTLQIQQVSEEGVLIKLKQR